MRNKIRASNSWKRLGSVSLDLNFSRISRIMAPTPTPSLTLIPTSTQATPTPTPTSTPTPTPTLATPTSILLVALSSPILVFAVVFLLFFLYFVWTKTLKGHRAEPRGKDHESDAEEPFLWGKRRIGVLVKRCDQFSTYEIENRIIDRLKRQSGVNIREKSWDRDEDDGRQPVIVFCVISSRIGADIENAMRGVHGNSRVVLVLLHCILSSLLSGDLSDDEELLDPSMKNRMIGIAHFAFSEREGLYSCRQNKDGFEQLATLVNFLA